MVLTSKAYGMPRGKHINKLRVKYIELDAYKLTDQNQRKLLSEKNPPNDAVAERESASRGETKASSKWTAWGVLLVPFALYTTHFRVL